MVSAYYDPGSRDGFYQPKERRASAPKVMADADRAEELARLFSKAQDAAQELSFSVSKMPFHFKACASDVKRGKGVSLEDIHYQGALLKSRASEALRAIAALHDYAAAMTGEQERGEA